MKPLTSTIVHDYITLELHCSYKNFSIRHLKFKISKMLSLILAFGYLKCDII